tara:strand:- start:2756 stop:3289 length:534 start_codon:yes stop_codon:yes gene_type:complete
MKKGKWSKEEETQLMEYVNDEVSWEDISTELQRSIPACKSRMKKLDKLLLDKLAANAETVLDELDELEGWTPEKDLDLLINFYELSIDEAKNKYGMTYAEIAGRLEYLIDSAQPRHIHAVMTATDTIRSKKLFMANMDNETWTTKRSIKKINRLQHKIDALKSKVLAKLNIGGKDNE